MSSIGVSLLACRFTLRYLTFLTAILIFTRCGNNLNLFLIYLTDEIHPEILLLYKSSNKSSNKSHGSPYPCTSLREVENAGFCRNCIEDARANRLLL